MNERERQHLHSFLSLEWYDEIVKFIFLFVTKTSELLLAAGIIVSTANFLTGGDVMSHNKGLSDAWSWAQAFAIDSSLGIVFMNAFEAVRERDKIKAIIFFTLTVLLATVAGLVTHFDAFAHVAGLSVTDKRVSGILPLWVMTALRSVAVIGFLLASRLKNISLRQFRLDWTQNAEVTQERTYPGLPSVASQIDYTALASALVQAMQQVGVIRHITVEHQETTALPEPKAEERPHPLTEGEGATDTEESAEAKMMIAYEQIQRERANQPNTKPISARDLAKRANIRRSTCSEWLQKRDIVHQEGDVFEETE